jgi:Transposase DDE domain
VIDATDLKVYGASEWLVEKHGALGRRRWRKLHLASEPDTGEILAAELRTTAAGDASQVGPLLEQITAPIASVTADGAYGGEPVYRAVPRSTADTAPSQRDRHIRMIEDWGRMGWQKPIGYGKALARGDRHVLLQSKHRPPPSGSDDVCPEDRSPDRLLRAQSDD